MHRSPIDPGRSGRTGFGCDGHVIDVRCKRLGDDLFAHVRAVRVRCVNKSDASVNNVSNEGHRSSSIVWRSPNALGPVMRIAPKPMWPNGQVTTNRNGVAEGMLVEMPEPLH